MRNKKLVLNAVIGGLLGINGIQVAEAVTEKDKDAKIEALEQRLLLLEERLGNAQTNNQPVNETIHKLDQEVKVLQRLNEVDKEAAAEAAKKAPKIDFGRNGFNFESADKAFSLRVRGLAQAQSRFFHDDGSIPTAGTTGANPQPVDTFELRRARLQFAGKLFKNFDYIMQTEFGGSGTPQIIDASVGYKLIPEVQVRAGRFITPFGLEHFQSAPNLTFVERSIVENLVPDRDNGIQFYGDIGTGLLEYQLGVGNGVKETSTDKVALDTSDDKEFFGRVFGAPFAKTDLAALKNLRFGIAGTSGKQGRSSVNGQAFNTVGRQTFFSYNNANAFLDGDRYRISPQVFYNYGPFGLLGEYVLNSAQLVNTTTGTKDRLDNTAFQVAASYVLTGEELNIKSAYPTWSNGIAVKPANDFDPFHGKWGAVQVAARYSQLNIDDAAFSRGYASRTASARTANSWEVGLNWFLNPNVSASLDYAQTRFDGGAVGVGGRLADRDTENAILSRIQLLF